jgi:hypothetical protein
MQAFTANEVRARFGEFLDRAQRESIGVLRNDRLVGVMVCAQDFEAMRAFFADRLQHWLDVSAQTAAQFGLTPEALDNLLADES